MLIFFKNQAPSFSHYFYSVFFATFVFARKIIYYGLHD